MKIVANPQRGCGYLKENALYLRAEGGGILPPFVKYVPPFPVLEKHWRGIKLINGMQFDSKEALETVPSDEFAQHCARLKDDGERAQHPDRGAFLRAILQDKGGDLGHAVSAWAFDLCMWIGEQYYPTSQDFIEEARKYGINKRIPFTTPPLILRGRTRLFLIHPLALRPEGCLNRSCLKAGLIGYSYITSVYYTMPADGKSPAWIDEQEELGHIEKVAIGPSRAKEENVFQFPDEEPSKPPEVDS